MTTQEATQKHEDIEVFFQLPYPYISGNNQYSHSRSGTKLKDEAIQYRSRVHGILYGLGLAQLKLQGPLWVEWQLHPPNGTRRDTDNARKPMADAITAAGVWEDDSNQHLLTEVFHWKPSVPGGRVLVWIRGLPPDLAAMEPQAADLVPLRTTIAHRTKAIEHQEALIDGANQGAPWLA